MNKLTLKTEYKTLPGRYDGKERYPVPVPPEGHGWRLHSAVYIPYRISKDYGMDSFSPHGDIAFV